MGGGGQGTKIKLVTFMFLKQIGISRKNGSIHNLGWSVQIAVPSTLP